MKEETHIKYKNCRKLFATLIKKSKKAYYNKSFETNIILRTHEKEPLISLKAVVSSTLTVLSLDSGDTITSPCDIANTFNNYFASIAEITEKNIKYSHIHLKNKCDSTIFLQRTNK